MFDLKGRVALVTGGNGGIGLGMARGLAEAGAAIAIAGRNQAKSEAAAAELAKLGVKTAVLTADVTDEAQCRQMVDDTVARLGRLDILINNAGINIRKPPQDLSLAEWKEVVDTNLTSIFTCSQAVYPVMKEAGGGKIINIGSMLSIFGAAVRGGLRRLQGRRGAAHQGAGLRLGQGQHPGQRRAAGLDRYRPHPQRARAGQGPQHHGADAHAGRPLGPARRTWRASPCSWRHRLRLRHRRGHSGRRRLFRAGLAAAAASRSSDFARLKALARLPPAISRS